MEISIVLQVFGHKPDDDDGNKISDGISKVKSIPPVGTWKPEPNLVPIHEEDVEIF